MHHRTWTLKFMTDNGRVKAKRILLVDDDPRVRQTLKLLLRLEGYTVTEAANGKEACHRFAPGDFDLVITDYSMPEMDGSELARTLKCLVPSQPIMMVTAHAEQAWRDDNPVDVILDKPFAIDDLRRSIARLLLEGSDASMDSSLGEGGNDSARPQRVG
jgi:CheY-like chemotaxis protein